MILTEEQAKARVESGSNLLNKFRQDKVAPKAEVTVIPIRKPGGGTGDGGEIPQAIRVEVAARARLGEKQPALADEFGITQTSVHKLERGRDGHLNEQLVEQRMDEIQDKALCRLMASLGFLDDEKLSKMSGKDLSAVAANMAKVAGNVRPSQGQGEQVHLHLYAPELRKEHNYKTIEVSSL